MDHLKIQEIRWICCLGHVRKELLAGKTPANIHVATGLARRILDEPDKYSNELVEIAEFIQRKA